MDDLLPKGALEKWNSREQVAERANIKQQIQENEHNRDQERMKELKRRDSLISQFSQFLEGPQKNLDIGIEHFERIYLEFKDIYVFGPLVKALRERNGQGDAQRASEIQEDHGVFIQ
jgi:hypothetical protein